MNSFPLIDLGSQHEAVERYIAGWTIESIETWLNNNGMIEDFMGKHFPFVPGGSYIFRSRFGIRCAFTVTSDLRFDMKDIRFFM